jgi:phosphoribosylanthranilate isomerase
MSTKLKIKICGMREPNNIKAIDLLNPDYVGFIFYEPSPRNMDKNFGAIPETNAKRVGVFVNESIEMIIRKARNFRLNIIQLHGEEDPDTCRELRDLGYEVWKAIKIDDNTDAEEVEPYVGVVDNYIFDTKGKQVGGNGTKFNWEKLNELSEFGPFLLSGGIGAEDVEEINKLKYENLVGLDLNSRFEIEPGFKDDTLIKDFLNKLN